MTKTAKLQLMVVREAARAIGVDHKTVGYWMEKGWIKPVGWRGSSWLILLSDCQKQKERMRGTEVKDPARFGRKEHEMEKAANELKGTLEDRARLKLPSPSTTFRKKESIENRWMPVTVYDVEARCSKQFLFELVIRGGSPVWRLHSVSFGG